MAKRRRLACVVALLVAWSGEAGAAEETGEVRGRVSIGIDGVSIARTGSVALYLERLDGRADFEVPAKPHIVEQKNATFLPTFSIVVAGQQIRFPNRDDILHNVFSLSKPNDFELGLYEAGKSKAVRLKQAGVVRLYCSIHESMRAVVLVSPTPWYARSDASGRFRIRDVPPGRYRITTFNEPLPSATQTLTVVAGQSSSIAIAIGPQTATP